MCSSFQFSALSYFSKMSVMHYCASEFMFYLDLVCPHPQIFFIPAINLYTLRKHIVHFFPWKFHFECVLKVNKPRGPLSHDCIYENHWCILR